MRNTSHKILACTSSSPSTSCYSPKRNFYNKCSSSLSSARKPKTVLISSITDKRVSYNSLVFQAVSLLGPPARFEPSKLKVVFAEDEMTKDSEILQRAYSLSHCDLTANLTLAVSNGISHDQLMGWYNRDDVLAEWKKVGKDMCLHVHCHVSGPQVFLDLAAEFRYYIFSKELPLVLKAILHGDSILFEEHPELMDSIVRVYFHSSFRKYNRLECWGPLRDAAEGKRLNDRRHNSLHSSEDNHHSTEKRGGPKAILQALFTFLL